MNWAIKDGVKKTGVSIAITTLEMDAGPILSSKEIEVEPNIQVFFFDIY